jgi:signal transduction histidine kinase
MRLVFDNLVLNACQAMPQGGVIRVRILAAEVDGNSGVRVEISDSGHGMDDQVLTRATDPFFTTRPSGTGLGLPIVERIVEAHGGRIEIDSERGRGTTVSLLLPLAATGQTREPEAKDRWAWTSRA